MKPQKNISRLTCKREVTISHEIVQTNLKIMAVIQPVLLIISISVSTLVTIERHLTSFVTCATINMHKAYAHISLFLVSKVCPMLKNSDIYEL